MPPLISSSGTKLPCRPKRQCSKTAMSVARDKATFKKPFTAQVDTEVQRPLKDTNGRHKKADRRDSFPDIKKEAYLSTSNKIENALPENAKSTPVGRLANGSNFSTSIALKSAGKPPLSTVLERKYTSRQATSIGQNLQNVVGTKGAKYQTPKCSNLKSHVSSFWGSSPKTPRQSLNYVKAQMVPSSKLIGSSGLACNSTPSSYEKLACSYGLSSTKLPEKDEAKAILHCFSYWKSQIQIAELAEEHHISVGLFQLALLCRAEPTHNILESIKYYKERHDVVAESLEKVLLEVKNETLWQTTESIAANLKVFGSVPITVAHGQSEPAYEISSVPCSARVTTDLCKSTNLGEGVKDAAIEVKDAFKGFSMGASAAVSSSETRDDINQVAANEQNLMNQVEHFTCNLYNQDKSDAYLPDIGRSISRYVKPCLNLSDKLNISQTKNSQANESPAAISSTAVSTTYEIQSHFIRDVFNSSTALVTPVLSKQQCLKNTKTSSQQEESQKPPFPVDDETQSPVLLKQQCLRNADTSSQREESPADAQRILNPVDEETEPRVFSKEQCSRNVETPSQQEESSADVHSIVAPFDIETESCVLPKQQCLRNADSSGQQEESPADVHGSPVPVDNETEPTVLPKQQCLRNTKSSSQQEESHKTPFPVDDKAVSLVFLKQQCLRNADTSSQREECPADVQRIPIPVDEETEPPVLSEEQCLRNVETSSQQEESPADLHRIPVLVDKVTESRVLTKQQCLRNADTSGPQEDSPADVHSSPVPVDNETEPPVLAKQQCLRNIETSSQQEESPADLHSTPVPVYDKTEPSSLPKQQCLRNLDTSSQQEESPADVYKISVPVGDETEPSVLQDASNSRAGQLALVDSMELCSRNALQSFTQPSVPADVQKLSSAQTFEHETESVETMDVNSLMRKVLSCIMPNSEDTGSFEWNKMEASFESQKSHNHTMGERSSRRCSPLSDMSEEIPTMKFVKDDAAQTEKSAEAHQFDSSSVNNQANTENYAKPAILSELLSDQTDINMEDVHIVVSKNYELEKIEIPDCQSKVAPAEDFRNADCLEDLSEQPDFQQMEQKSAYKSGNVVTKQSTADVLDMRKVPFANEVGDATQAQLNLAPISTPTVASAQINLLTLSNTKGRGSRNKMQRKFASNETKREQTQVLEERERKPVVERLEAAVQSAHEKDTNLATASATNNKDESKVVSCRNRNQIPVATTVSSRTPLSVAKQGKFFREEKSASYETPKVQNLQCYQMTPRTVPAKGKGNVLRSAEKRHDPSILVEVEHQRENLLSSTSRKTRSSKSEYERDGKARCRSLRGGDEFQSSVNGVVAKNLEMELGSETICKEKEKEPMHTQSIRNVLRDGATVTEGNAYTNGTPESLRRSARIQMISSRLRRTSSTLI